MVGEVELYQNYEQYKKELDAELQKTAEGFVRIGYLLKVARDTDVLRESGYKSVAEFAQAEYGLDKTQVSRFISINDRFAEGGYSDHLLPDYQGFGYAKLTIMLQIPEEIAEELSPNLSKADVQAIKEEIDEERQISDIEVALEAAQAVEEAKEARQQDREPFIDVENAPVLDNTLYELFRQDPALYQRIWERWNGEGLNEQVVKALLAPSGEKVYSVRIRGMGRVMLVLDDQKETVTITNVRTMEKETLTWGQVTNELAVFIPDEGETAKEEWEWIYQEPFPEAEEKEKVAPVQQSQKKEPRKESKVQKAKTPEKPKKTSAEAPSEEAREPEEQLPGQMSVEDYPELMTDGGEKDGKSAGMDEGNDEPGMSDCSGDEDADGRSEDAEGAAGGEIPGTDEVVGASEGRGREGDLKAVEVPRDLVWTSTEPDLEEVREQIRDAWEDLAKMPKNHPEYLAAYQMEELYKKAIRLAAGIEQLMLWKRRKMEKEQATGEDKNEE